MLCKQQHMSCAIKVKSWRGDECYLKSIVYRLPGTPYLFLCDGLSVGISKQNISVSHAYIVVLGIILHVRSLLCINSADKGAFLPLEAMITYLL